MRSDVHTEIVKSFDKHDAPTSGEGSKRTVSEYSPGFGGTGQERPFNSG